MPLENRLRWSAQARGELEALLERTAKRWPETLNKIKYKVWDYTESIRQHPYIGRSGIRSGTREMVLGRYPFILVYKVDEHPDGAAPTVVHIVSIRHARMQGGSR